MDQLPDPFSGDKYEETFHEESPNFGSIYSLSQLDNNYIDSADYLNDAFDDLAPPYPTFGDKISNDKFTFEDDSHSKNEFGRIKKSTPIPNILVPFTGVTPPGLSPTVTWPTLATSTSEKNPANEVSINEINSGEITKSTYASSFQENLKIAELEQEEVLTENNTLDEGKQFPYLSIGILTIHLLLFQIQSSLSNFFGGRRIILFKALLLS